MSHSAVRLREVRADDLDIFFHHQQDTASNDLAKVYPRDRDDFDAHWARILQNPEVIARTIEFEGAAVGNINCFRVGEETHIGYWIGRENWGKGITTQALQQFLGEVSLRPLHAHVAEENARSIRVLENCGFERVGKCNEPGDERFMACVELIYEIR